MYLSDPYNPVVDEARTGVLLPGNVPAQGRLALAGTHSVFRVHDIPPAAYMAPAASVMYSLPLSVREPYFPEPRRQGDVCTQGLWDEVVDEPLAYPFFAAGERGACYIPDWRVEPVVPTAPAPESKSRCFDRRWHAWGPADRRRDAHIASAMPSPSCGHCDLACRFSE